MYIIHTVLSIMKEFLCTFSGMTLRPGVTVIPDICNAEQRWRALALVLSLMVLTACGQQATGRSRQGNMPPPEVNVVTLESRDLSWILNMLARLPARKKQKSGACSGNSGKSFI
jgi:hypothetical protein